MDGNCAGILLCAINSSISVSCQVKRFILSNVCSCRALCFYISQRIFEISDSFRDLAQHLVVLHNTVNYVYVLLLSCCTSLADVFSGLILRQKPIHSLHDQ